MGAAYDSQERDPAPRCFPGTRKAVLKRIETWVKAGSRGTSILWLHSLAGAGKSAIAQTVAETCAGRGELAASFFFARTVASRNALKHLFPTIVVQIVSSAPEKRQRLESTLKNDPWIIEEPAGYVHLVASLFRQGHALTPSSPSLVIIDGLDECQGDDDQCRILAVVSDMVNIHHVPLRFLIVSRPEVHLCEAFEKRDLANTVESLPLVEARDDVLLYLQSEFSRIYSSKSHEDVMASVPRPWPSEDVIHRLVRNSGGFFIYPSTVIRFVDEESFSPVERLDQVLNGPNSAVPPCVSAPFAELDKLYLQILSSYPRSTIPILKCILGYVELVTATGDNIYITVADIEAFLGLPHGQVKQLLRGLRYLVSVRQSEGDSFAVAFRLNHPSFGDFLGDKDRSGIYHVDFEEWLCPAFCDAFCLGRNTLGFSVDAEIESALRHPKGLSVTVTCSL